MKIIWLLFAWNPQAHFMQPVMWFPTERACRVAEAAEAKRGVKVPPATCGAVTNVRAQAQP